MTPVTILTTIGAIIAIIALAIFSIIYLIKFILVGAFAILLAFIGFSILPPAADNVPLTVENYDSLPILSREYQNSTSEIERKYALEPIKSKVVKRIFGTHGMRSSEDGYLYVINIEDDYKFGLYGEGVDKMKIDEKKYSKYVNGCRNNTIGCEVKIKVTYKFMLDYKFFSTEVELYR